MSRAAPLKKRQDIHQALTEARRTPATRTATVAGLSTARRQGAEAGQGVLTANTDSAAAAASEATC